jgi:hypothetical protein
MTREIKTKIAGVTYDDPANKGLNRQETIRRMVKAGQRLELRREPDNPHDGNAVAVWLQRRVVLMRMSYHLGYLPGDVARDVARAMDGGAEPDVRVLQVTGGGSRSLGVNIVIRI